MLVYIDSLLLIHQANFVDGVRHPFLHRNTGSTAQGGGGSFKKRKRIGEIDCCE